ncbi:MAG: N-acetylmuramoyl-L-alanine amidase family protein [Limisphaerales bacterium]
MRWPFRSLIVLLVGFGSELWISSAQAAPPRSPTPPARLIFGGHEYQDAGAWARDHSLRLEWDGRSRKIAITKRGLNLEFAPHSRVFQLNGVGVWLCSAVITNRGRAYLATVDLKSTLAPLLVPARNQAGQKVRTVCLDPGHGGKQPGHVHGTREEKTYALLLAHRVRHLLQEAGLRVVMTREADQTVELEQRPAHAKYRRADLFVSLHYNATHSGSDTAHGAEVYCLTPAGMPSTNADDANSTSTRAYPGNLHNSRSVLAAYQIQKAMTTQLKVTDRGVRRARFVVLRAAEMPAVLVEGGFMSDPEDARKIWSATGRAELARAITDGILAYKRLVER